MKHEVSLALSLTAASSVMLSAQEPRLQDIRSKDQIVQVDPCVNARQKSEVSSSQKRNLKLYESGGYYKIDYLVFREGDYQAIHKKVTEFIWHHWQEHRLGRVTTTHDTKEGAAYTFNFFIEPDDKGVWNVAINREIEHLLPPNCSRRTFLVTDEQTAYQLERIPQFNKDSYALRLKDINGKVLMEW